MTRSMETSTFIQHLTTVTTELDPHGPLASSASPQTRGSWPEVDSVASSFEASDRVLKMGLLPNHLAFKAGGNPESDAATIREQEQ